MDWLIVAGVIYFAYALVSKRLSTTVITGPMLFVAVGLLLGIAAVDSGVLEIDPDDEAIKMLLEATLAIVLFSDAAVINSTNWRREAFIPGRLLSIALPWTIIVGLGAALLMFPEFGVWEAGLIAAVLAPTDAALGQAVISNPRVPQRIRQGLAGESGLNDGIALTAVLIFLAGAEGSLEGSSFGSLLSFMANEVVVAAVVGIALGWAGGRLLVATARRDWVSPTWMQIGTLAIASCVYGVAVALGSSGFIAVWLAGLMVGRSTRDELREVTGFSETLGNSLTMMSFLVFGAYLLRPAIEVVTWPIVVYALLSLTIIRMIPVAASMFGTQVRPPTVLFLGWFGPRGLASIVLASLVVESSTLPAADLVTTIALITVGISVFAHGATSWAGSEAYADWYEESTSRRVAPSEGEVAPTKGVPQRFQTPGTVGE